MLIDAHDSGRDAEARDAGLRRRFVRVAVLVAVLAAAHFADHVVRGALVVSRGLDPTWNHSGWPFRSEFTPFSFSLILVYGILLGGILFTRRGPLWAGFWLAATAVLSALVVYVHFLAGDFAESPAVIVGTYGNPASALPALVVLFGMIGGLILMGINTLHARNVSGRW